MEHFRYSIKIQSKYFFIWGKWSCSYLEYPQLGDGKARLTFKAAGHAVGGAGGGGRLCTAECPDVYGQFKLALDKQLTGGLAKEGVEGECVGLANGNENESYGTVEKWTTQWRLSSWSFLIILLQVENYCQS
ncbi:hypothetical protein ACLKA6_002848 [Drosophila palustris]